MRDNSDLRMRRIAVWLLAGAVGLVGLVLAAAPAAAQSPSLIIDYSVGERGDVQADLGTFGRIVGETLADPRGWSLGGQILFQEVESGGEFSVVLASPAAVESAAPVCSAQFSCRVGDTVLINEERWLQGAAGYPLPLEQYRPYVINHEVGHWLGLDHRDCPGSGPAPVMQQQSKGIAGCEATVWPLESEQQAVADRFQVELRRDETVGPGDVGAGVATWQDHLNELTGAGLAVDGIYGPNTEEATRDFERFFGLSADAVAEPQTRDLARFLLRLDPRALALGARGEDVAEWQRNLNDIADAGLAVDGIYGPNTRAATVGFERFFGLPADGDVREDDRALMDFLQALQAQQ